MNTHRLRTGLIGSILLCALVVVIAPPAGAGFSGVNARVAFVSDRDGDKEIWAMRSNGSGLVQLTSNTSNDYDPTFSADGSRIAFITDRDGSTELYIMAADGTTQRRVTNNSMIESHPTWAPNGTMIAFAGKTGTDSDIYTIKPTGTNQVDLTPDAVAFDANPAWSPGGLSIAFDSTNRAGNPGPDIYTMQKDGTAVTRLTTTSSDTNPNWSPDNKNLVFQSGRDVIESGASHFADVNGPVGMAFTSNAMLVTQLVKDKVLSIGDSGTVNTFATLPSTGGANLERYIAVSPGLGGWLPGYVYVTVRHDILQITPDGNTVTIFTTLPDLPQSNNSINFDTVGTFGYDMILAAGNKADLYRIKSDGTFSLVKDMHNVAGELEDPEVAPLTYAPYGGQVIVTSKLDSTVFAIAADGTYNVVGSWVSADDVAFIPASPCNYGSSGGAYFLIMRDTNEVMKFPLTAFSGLSGALIPGETTTDIGLFDSVGGGIQISQFSGPIGNPELEGTAFASCPAARVGGPSAQTSPQLAGVASPDGCVVCPHDIYRMTSGGLSQTRLTVDAADDASPAWSPDNSSIVFQTDRDDPNLPSCGPTLTCKYEVYTMSATDGSGQTDVSNNLTANDTAADWEAAGYTVTVVDFAFQPQIAKPKLGASVYFDFVGPTDHNVTDNSGMGLFGSGNKVAGAYFVFAFSAAGKYPYICTLHPTLMTGTVQVPMTAVPKVGNITTVFTLTWATGSPPSGYKYDVQISRPGQGFVDWVPNTSLKSSTFTPDAGVGTYAFQARLRNTQNGFASNYSAIVSITVS